MARPDDAPKLRAMCTQVAQITQPKQSNRAKFQVTQIVHNYAKVLINITQTKVWV